MVAVLIALSGLGVVLVAFWALDKWCDRPPTGGWKPPGY